MPKTQSRLKSSTGRQEPPNTDVNFKIGDRAIIKSTHPLFPSVSCTITAFPSVDAAIVEFENGVRERLLLEYLEVLPVIEIAAMFNANKSGSFSSQNNSPYQPPGNYSDTSIVEELSPDEERERHRLELKVERAFYEAGAALRDLRDKRLYRSTHKTFEQYCIDRFAYTRRRPYQLIEAAIVFENLCTNGTQNNTENDLCTNGTQECLSQEEERQILPTSERQVRDLISLEPNMQRDVWQQAVIACQGKVPSSRVVKGIVERMKEKPLFLASDYCEIGEVFFLQRLSGEERKYNGCWAIAIQVENRFTVKAAIFRGFLEVKQENIERIDCEQTQAEIRDIYQRLTQLTLYQLDPIDEAQIEILCRRPWFTDRQKQALSAMEEVYQVKVKP